LEQAKDLRTTLICFETPHRLQDALADIATVLSDRRIAVARELTKLHEEFVRGTVQEVIAHFKAHAPRGEFVLVIEGAPEQPGQTAIEGDWRPHAEVRLRELRDQGVGGSSAARQVAKGLGVARNEVYALWVELQDEG
jgi:16S rRNA (cytidine1402-2'-O)-methyltransferase